MGQTPKEIVWARDKVRLYRYRPQASRAHQRFPVPLLLVNALTLRPYILDLLPGHSFLEYLVHKGFDVYLLD